MSEVVRALLNCNEQDSALIGSKLTAVYTSVLSSEDVRPEAVKLFPVLGSGYDSYSTVEYGEYTGEGKAKIVANNADDIPQADVGRVNRSATLYQIVNHFRFSTLELEAALRTNAPLSTAKHMAAMKAQAAEIDRIFWRGDSNYGITGFAGFALNTVQVRADGTGNSASWAAKTADQIARDLRQIAESVARATQGQQHANTLILSADAFELAASARNQLGLSALDMFKGSHPEVTVVKSYAMGAAGNTDAVAMVKGEATAGIWLPMYGQVHPAQRDGLVLKTIVESRTAGLIVNDTSAIFRATGLVS